jgi:hypothetical protein
MFARPAPDAFLTPIQVYALDLEPKVTIKPRDRLPGQHDVLRWNFLAIPETVHSWSHDKNKDANRNIVALNLIHRWNRGAWKPQEQPPFLCDDDSVLLGLVDTLHPDAAIVTTVNGTPCVNVSGHAVMVWLSPRRPFYPSCWMRMGQDGDRFPCSACTCARGGEYPRSAGCTGKLGHFEAPPNARRRAPPLAAAQAAAHAARRASERARRQARDEDEDETAGSD